MTSSALALLRKDHFGQIVAPTQISCSVWLNPIIEIAKRKVTVGICKMD